MSRLLTDICNQFESIWNTLPEEQRQDKGSLQLTREQQTAVIETIRQYVKPEAGVPVEKTILVNISTNPHITRLALNAIQNKEEFKDLKQELSSTILENLQNKLLSSKNQNEESVVLENWLETYKDHFDAQTIGSMDADTLFHLVEILAKFQSQDDLLSIIQSLPENGRKYLDILKSADSNIPDLNLFENTFNEKEVHIALAHFISYKKSRINKLGYSEERLLQIAPYLRYGNFRKLDAKLIDKLLDHSQKINHLIIANGEIKSIKSDLTNCYKLDCSCLLLEELPDLPNCQHLNCSGCDALKKLPDLPNCQYLNCTFCGLLEKLPDLPDCQKLICDYCENLREMGALPNCESLSCIGCKVLEKLSDIPNCKTLVCNSCNALKELLNFPNCQKLDCSGCGALEKISDLPNCQDFDCSMCRALEEVSNLPNCQRLVCSGCENLQTLPQELLVCQYFNSEDCPRLGQLPEVPANCDVRTGPSQRLPGAQMNVYSPMTVDVERLSSDPKSLLLELGRSHLLNMGVFPYIVYYGEGNPSEAVDAGGVRRDFVTRLLREVFKSENPTHLDIQENGWPEKMCDQETIVGRELDQETIDCYRTLGKLFALCYPSDSPIKPGNIFPESVYRAIAMVKDPNNFSDEELISCYLLLKGVPLEVLKVIQENDISTVEDKTIYFASYLLDPDWDENFQEIDPREFFNKPENKEKLQATLVENAMREPSLNAISWIAKEMEGSLGNVEWNNFRVDERRMERIQGVVSSEEVIKALNWEQGEAVGDKQHEETMKFMENWIRSADNEQLRSFIFAVTGNNAISEEIVIKLETYNRGPNHLPSAHTCFFSLELSAEYPDQQTFDQIMKTFLEYACHGFDSV